MNTQLNPASRATIKGLAGIVGAAIALHGTPAHAQQSELDLLREQLTKLQSRIDKLEANKIDVKSATPTVASNSKMPVVVSGLLQEQFNAYFDQKNGAAAAQPDTFRLRRGEIRLTAPALTPRVSGTVMFDAAKTTNTTQQGSLLQELSVSYNFKQSKQGQHFLDIGQYKPGFGYESDLVSSSALQMTERAQIYRYSDIAANTVAGAFTNRPGGGLGDARDQGARVRGTFADGTIAYNVGVFNGFGERQNGNAGGDPKVVVGRLIFKPKGQAFQLGVSGMQGNTRNDTVATGALDRHAYNGFIAYKKDKLSAMAEYTEAKSKVVNGGLFKNGKGYYGGLGYMLTPKLELVTRYDNFKQEATAGTGTSTEITGGLNYYIKGNNAKIQTDLVKVKGEPNALSANPSNGTFNSLQLRTQFQVAF